MIALPTLQLLGMVAMFPCVLAQETVLPYSPTVIPHSGETCPPQSIREETRYNITEEIRTLLRNSSVVATEAPTGAGCGGTGWRQVAFINTTDPSYNCPSGWRLTSYSKWTCGRTSTGSLCESVTFSTAGHATIHQSVRKDNCIPKWSDSSFLSVQFEQPVTHT